MGIQGDTHRTPAGVPWEYDGILTVVLQVSHGNPVGDLQETCGVFSGFYQMKISKDSCRIPMGVPQESYRFPTVFSQKEIFLQGSKIFMWEIKTLRSPVGQCQGTYGAQESHRSPAGLLSKTALWEPRGTPDLICDCSITC